MKIQDTFKEFFTLQQEIRKVRVDQKHKEVLKHPREKEYLDKKTLGYDSRYEENLRGKNIRQAVADAKIQDFTELYSYLFEKVEDSE